jgi:hypothetical protein
MQLHIFSPLAYTSFDHMELFPTILLKLLVAFLADRLLQALLTMQEFLLQALNQAAAQSFLIILAALYKASAVNSQTFSQ